MSERLTYAFDGQVATITMDDGRVNALSPAMLADLRGALDQAAADGAVVVLTGRDGIFSGGFDLKTLTAGGDVAAEMLRAGFDLAEAMLSFPAPVIVACPGHAIAMGVFVLLSGDYRIGVRGPFRITANEVAIGLVMPRAAIEVCRQRLTPAAYNRAVVLADVFDPEAALGAGFFDQLAEPADLAAAAADAAARALTLDRRAHAATKLRARQTTLSALHAAIEADDTELRAMLAVS